MKIVSFDHQVNPLSLVDFLQVAAKRFDPDNTGTIIDLAEPLVGLAANVEEILQMILRSVESRLSSALIGEMPTYHYLYRSETFGLRTTVWIPEKQSVEVRQIENGLFAYDYPHNHNFDLLTTTVLGEGYDTEVFEIQSNNFNNMHKGQRVTCKALGTKRLSPNTVFLYESQKDVHSQVPVGSLSVALNFMVPSRRPNTRQYSFNILPDNTLEVAGTPVNSDARRDFFVNLLLRGREAGMFEHVEEAQIAALCQNTMHVEMIDRLKDMARSLTSEEMQDAVRNAPRGNGTFAEVAKAVRQRRIEAN